MTSKITPGIWKNRGVLLRVYYKKYQGHPFGYYKNISPNLDPSYVSKIAPSKMLEWNDDKTYSVKL